MQVLRLSAQAGPVVGHEDGIARIGRVVLDAGGLASDEAFQPNLAFQAGDVLRGVIGNAGNQIAVGNEMAGTHVRQRMSARAEQTFARRFRFRWMLGELDDLPLGNSANLVQMQPPLALLFLRIHSGAEEGINDHGQGGDCRATHGENYFPVGKQGFQRTDSVISDRGIVRCTEGLPASTHPHSCVFYRNLALYGKLRLRGKHRIAQHSHASNTDLDSVAGNEGADGSRCSRGDNVARHQGHHAGDPAYKKRRGKDHQRSSTGLAPRPVNVRLNEDVRWVEIGFYVRADRARSIETWRACELDIAFLQVARGNIVKAGVTYHEGERVIGVAQLRAAPADNQRELAFVLHAQRILWQDDRFFWTDDGRRRLEEHQRFFWHFVAQLRRVRRVITPNTNTFRRLNGSKQPHISEASSTHTARPFHPGRAGNLDDVFTFDHAVTRRCARSRSIAHLVTADFHWRLTRAVVGMGGMRFAGSPDRGNDPAERTENHIHNGAQHENVKRAKPIAEPAKDQAEHAIAQAENEPAKKAGRQEMTRHAQEPKDGQRREESQNRGGGDIALQGKALQERHAIGDDQPSGKNQGQANTDVNTRPNGRVREDVEPTITWQMWTKRHRVPSSQRCLQSFNPDLIRWLRDLDHHGCARRTFISRAVYGGHGVPIAVAGLYRRITNRRRGQQILRQKLSPCAFLLTFIDAISC